MPSLFTLILVLLGKYLVPFIFAIGFFFLLYGVVEYFIIGQEGDEERSQHGRELFLKSIGWFFVGIVAQLLVILLGFVGSFSWPISGTNVPRPGGGADVDSEDAVLQIPDVPTRQ